MTQIGLFAQHQGHGHLSEGVLNGQALPQLCFGLLTFRYINKNKYTLQDVAGRVSNRKDVHPHDVG